MEAVPHICGLNYLQIRGPLPAHKCYSNADWTENVLAVQVTVSRRASQQPEFLGGGELDRG